MPTSDSSPARKEFDYSGLDDKSRNFVQQQTGEIRGLMKRTAQGIVEIGQKLSEVKERLGHGRFGTWLESEFRWSYETAARFMRVYTQFNSVNLTDVSIAPSALYLLAAPSISKAVIQEAIARAEAGESITYTTAKEIKKKYTSTTKSKSKVKSEPEQTPLVSPPLPTPPLPQSSPLQIVSIRPSAQASAAEVAKGEATGGAIIPQRTPPVSTPESYGSWWRLSGRHLLYCGDPNSDEFLAKLPEQVQLLLAFPSDNFWQPRIVADVRLILNDYLPMFQNSDLLDEVIEPLVLSFSQVGNFVMVGFIPSPVILSIINRAERRGVLSC